MEKRNLNPTSVASEEPAGWLYRLLLASLLPGMIYFAFVAAVRFTPLMRWGDTPDTSPLVAFAALLSAVATILIGFLVIRSAPGNVCGPLLVLFGICSANTGLYNTVQNGYAQAALQFTNLSVYLWVLVALFVYFPDGAAYRPWAGRVIGGLALPLLAVAALGIVSDLSLDSAGTVNPLYQEAFAPLRPIGEFAFPPLLFGSLVLSISAFYLRYRTVTGHKRQQIRWFMFCASSMLVLLLAWFVGFATQQPNEGLYFWLLIIVSDIALPLIPAVGVGVGILRHRLYDIDVIINRTLVYVPLTAILAGLYAASIASLQKLFVAITGEKSDAAIVITTLLLTTTFTPIKNRLQSTVDKRFKEGHDATKKLKALTQQVKSVEEVIDTGQITAKLLEESSYAFNATSGAIYLKRDGDLQVVHATDKWDGQAKLSMPLESNGEQLGLLQLGTRSDGRDYSPEDQQLLKQAVDRIANVVWLAGRGR